ncbi:MAG: hypothetical protein U5K73_00665 [Halofilum sp. (in: g-proteobacteria)]|nr:hypothetical protein [Halofilum sp. (in: g-proteobacteria)]
MPSIEDTLREINRGSWTIGYTGQSPERLKLPRRAPRARSTPPRCEPRAVPATANIYGLPWPCWGTPEMGHPGTPVLYDTSRAVSRAA